MSLHNEINLKRLLRRLEKSASEAHWSDNSFNAWIEVQGSLQKVKHAKKLLADVELEDFDPTPTSAQRYEEWRTRLDRLDALMKTYEQTTAPKSTRPVKLLPKLPLPADPLPTEPPPGPSEVSPTLDPASASLSTATVLDNLLDSARDVPPPAYTPPILSSQKPTKSTASSTALEAGTTARQRAMGEQMAMMAEQLKRNAVHFSDLLEKDKLAMEEVDSKLEGNFGYMQKTRIMTRDLRSKTGSTFWLTMVSIIVVLLAFVFMIPFIRFSGR
ncbi:unnamed protein product [Mycena citricolor]|uniref:Uncharacterized protein n=1 Tax=Mycena citricolor TaxID=2018698 RepID=A0AAD2GSE4_9AGAR|nr:unnamed protein product [Mycena citricolor]